MQIVVSISVWYQKWHINNVYFQKESIATIASIPRCMKEAWTPTPLTYSIVYSTCIVWVPARRVSRPYVRNYPREQWVHVCKCALYAYAWLSVSLLQITFTYGHACVCVCVYVYARFVNRCVLPCNYTCPSENNRITDKYRSRSCVHAYTNASLSFILHRYLYLFNQEIRHVLM